MATAHKRKATMRLTVRTNLAMRTLMYCAAHPHRRVRRAEIAATCQASENHIAVVVNQLSHHGFVDTQRGRTGGIRLAHPPDQLKVSAVFTAFERVQPLVECQRGPQGGCPLDGACRLPATLNRALDAFYAVLDDVTLADLIDDNADLHARLAVGAC